MFDIDYIVVPVDFSRGSKAALAVARELGDPSTTVEALHVVGQWPRFMNDVLFPYAPLGEDAAEIEAELVEAARESIIAYHELSSDPSVVYGKLQETLLDRIRSTPSQLVVIGGSGETGAAPDMLGSVAQRVVRSAGRPTLVTREHGPTRIERVLIALDLTAGSQRVFETGIGLAQRTGASVEILHVVSDPFAGDHANVLSHVLKWDRKKDATRVRARVEALFDRLMRNIEPRFAEQDLVQHLASQRHVALGEVADEILTRAAEIDAHAVVIGTQRAAVSTAGRLGGVAAKVVRRATSHVVMVPVPPQERLSGED